MTCVTVGFGGKACAVDCIDDVACGGKAVNVAFGVGYAACAVNWGGDSSNLVVAINGGGGAIGFCSNGIGG